MSSDPSTERTSLVVRRRPHVTGADLHAGRSATGRPLRRVVSSRVDAALALGRTVAAGPSPLRRALLRRAAALLVALLVLATGVHEMASAERARAGWGRSVRVLVLARDVDAGAQLSPADLEWQQRPAALVPDDAVTARPASGRRAATGLVRGEVLLTRRLTDGQRGAWALDLGDHEAAVQVTLGHGLSGVRRGDRVDVIAMTSADRSAQESPGSPFSDVAPLSVPHHDLVAAGARVIQVDGTSVVLAVDRNSATTTAAAAISGPVALVVHP